MKNIFFTFIFFLFCSFSANALEYKIDYGQSKVGFSGTHAGKAFKGEFKSWQGTIFFDPADLSKSDVTITFDLLSTATGDKMYDGTLPQADWFDTKKFQKALFNSKNIIQNTDGSFLAKGDLTIRGVTKPVEFSFTLSDPKVNPVRMQSAFSINRLDFAVGMESDPKAEWVSNSIAITIDLFASAQ